MFVNKMLESGDFVWHKYSFIKTCHSHILQWRTQDLAVMGGRCDFQTASLRSAFSASTSRPLLVCCLSPLRSKRRECNQPTEVGPFAINVTFVYYMGKVINIQKEEFPRNPQPEEERDPNWGNMPHFVFEF